MRVDLQTAAAVTGLWTTIIRADFLKALTQKACTLPVDEVNADVILTGQQSFSKLKNNLFSVKKNVMMLN